MHDTSALQQRNYIKKNRKHELSDSNLGNVPSIRFL